MKVFISWSGERSKARAILVEKFLSRVITSIQPWISTNIDKGSRGFEEIANTLSEVDSGIFCLTKDSLDSKWMHFEAGAITKTKDARGFTILFDGLTPAQIAPPIGWFQHTEFTSEQIFSLVQQLNDRLPKSGAPSLKPDILVDQFNNYWPKLQQDVAALPDVPQQPRLRSDTEKIDEILAILRGSKEAAKSQEEETRVGVKLPNWRFALGNSPFEERVKKAMELAGSPIDPRTLAAFKAGIQSASQAENIEALEALRQLEKTSD